MSSAGVSSCPFVDAGVRDNARPFLPPAPAPAPAPPTPPPPGELRVERVDLCDVWIVGSSSSDRYEYGSFSSGWDCCECYETTYIEIK